jgi:integrase
MSRVHRESTKAAADKYIQKSVAPGTMRGYKREWIWWLKFAKKRGYWTALPRSTELQDYLVNEVAARKSVSVFEAVSASVCWHCAEVGKPSTFEDKRIMLVVRGLKASFCRPAQPRLPFTRSHVRKFMDIGRRSPRLWRAAVILAVCFADFLRFSQVAFVRLEDVTVSEKKVSFRVRKAKNHRLGFEVCLPVDKKRRYCVGALVSDQRWFWPKVSAEYSAEYSAEPEYSVPPAETESQNSAFKNIQ